VFACRPALLSIRLKEIESFLVPSELVNTDMSERCQDSFSDRRFWWGRAVTLVYSAAAVVRRVRRACIVAVLMSRSPIEVDDTLRQEARNVGDG
jgi:hypothetical protein